jgi:hypothetical protein
MLSQIRHILLLVLILCIVPAISRAGLSSGRSVGMGGAYSTVARGAESAYWNPADLGFTKSPEWNLMILSLGVNVANNSFNLEQYNRYNGTFLSAEDKQTILNLIPDNGFNGSISADLMGLGVSWHNFAFTVSGRGTSELSFPKDPIQTLFFGNEINDTVMLSGSDGDAFASVEFGLSYGRSIWKKTDCELFGGAGIRIIRGMLYQKIKEAEGEVFALETGVEGQSDFLVRSAEGGLGYGIDMGLAMKYKGNWTIGLSCFNVLNHINWNRNTKERVYQVRIDSLLAEDFDSDSLVIEESYSQPIAHFNTHQPIMLQAGVSYQLRKTILSFDLRHGQTSATGQTRKTSASVGAEHQLYHWLNLRGGISLGENYGITIAQGLGFNVGIYQLDLGITNQNGVWPTKSKGVSVAISNQLHFK